MDWANLCIAFLIEDENQEGKDGSYIECYMKENKDSSIELAREHVIKLIEDDDKQSLPILQEYIKSMLL
uniref:Terpene synthase metal-binding domain-containing protein n=1 Tax=Solanum lycopersicum TaxID=4081 RepID=A0A3Q7IAP4_SOLLC